MLINVRSNNFNQTVVFEKKSGISSYTLNTEL